MDYVLVALHVLRRVGTQHTSEPTTATLPSEPLWIPRQGGLSPIVIWGRLSNPKPSKVTRVDLCIPSWA